MAPSIVDLPKHLMVTILAEVTNDSSYDLFQSKFCCKKFLEAAKDEYASKNIILSQIMSILYRRDGDLDSQLKAKAFLDVCVDAGNPKAIYQGMEMFMGYDDNTIVDKEEGAKLIRKALLLGHEEATFFYNFAIVDKFPQLANN